MLADKQIIKIRQKSKQGDKGAIKCSQIKKKILKISSFWGCFEPRNVNIRHKTYNSFQHNSFLFLQLYMTKEMKLITVQNEHFFLFISFTFFRKFTFFISKFLIFLRKWIYYFFNFSSSLNKKGAKKSINAL